MGALDYLYRYKRVWVRWGRLNPRFLIVVAQIIVAYAIEVDGAFWRIRSVLNGRRPLALWLPLPGLLFSGGGDREILLFFRLWASGWYLDS